MAWRDLIETFNSGARDERLRKEKAVDLAAKLYSMGIDDPATINRTVGNYVKTGMLALPTTEERRTELGGGGTTQQGRTAISDLGTTEVTQQPIRLGPGFTVIDPTSGDPTTYEGLGRNVRVLPRPAQEPVHGMTRFYNEGENGAVQVINAVPSKTDRWIRVGKQPAGGRGRGRTAREQAAITTIGIFQRALIPKIVDGVAVAPQIPAELEEQVVDAAKTLNIPFHWETIPAVPPHNVMGFQWGGRPESRRLVIGDIPADMQGSAYQAPEPAPPPPAPNAPPSEPRYQRNRRTGERRVSYDGGQTWQPVP